MTVLQGVQGGLALLGLQVRGKFWADERFVLMLDHRNCIDITHRLDGRVALIRGQLSGKSERIGRAQHVPAVRSPGQAQQPTLEQQHLAGREQQLDLTRLVERRRGQQVLRLDILHRLPDLPRRGPAQQMDRHLREQLGRAKHCFCLSELGHGQLGFLEQLLARELGNRCACDQRLGVGGGEL